MLHVLYEIHFQGVTLERVVSGAEHSLETYRRDLRARFGGCIAECIRAGFSEQRILGMHPTIELCASQRGGGGDRGVARELANRIAGEELGEGAGRDRLKALSWELIQEAAQEAIGVLCEPRHSEALARVADALVAKGKLSPAEVERLIEPATAQE